MFLLEVGASHIRERKEVMPKEEKFLLEGEPHPDIEIKEFTTITEKQRQEAHRIIRTSFTTKDRIDDAHIDIDPTTGKIVLLVKANMGNVGNQAIESVYSLN